jgi:hypothetical protein
MSSQQKRLVHSCNKGFGDLGDESPAPGQAHTIEDRLLEVLEDCIMGPAPGLLCVKVKPFREWLSRYGAQAGWNPENIALCLAEDVAAESTVLFAAATLKRMAHTQEWAVNKLLERGLPIHMIPEGQSYLGC